MAGQFANHAVILENEILFFSGIDTDMHVRQVWQNILFYKIPYVLIVLSS